MKEKGTVTMRRNDSNAVTILTRVDCPVWVNKESPSISGVGQLA